MTDATEPELEDTQEMEVEPVEDPHRLLLIKPDEFHDILDQKELFIPFQLLLAMPRDALLDPRESVRRLEETYPEYKWLIEQSNDRPGIYVRWETFEEVPDGTPDSGE